MSTAELKIDLINQITNITDEIRLEELVQLLNFQSDKSVYITTLDEKKAISVARKQIENGEVVSNSDFQNEISQWLSK